MSAGNGSTDPELESLLLFIRDARGFDFTGYKRSSLQRRIDKRMGEVGVSKYPEYAERLELDTDEWPRLFDTILINVTRFFRDRQVWDWLAAEVLPSLAEPRGEGPLRVWSAGCASGEETYTLAMLLAEALGPERFRTSVKIYGTDVDESALSSARVGFYSEAAVNEVPEHLRERYFVPRDGGWSFRQEFRRSVVFGRNDLIKDAPISRLDLLVARNTLMYFDAETQASIIERFHFALNDYGVLFLGRSETMLSRSGLFAPLDQRRRVFAKSPRRRGFAIGARPAQGVLGRWAETSDLREAAFESSPFPQLLVGVEGDLLLVNARARAALGLTVDDIGAPLGDLDAARPLDLAGLVERVRREDGPVRHRTGAWLPPGAPEAQHHDVHVTPLHIDGTIGAVGVVLVDVTDSAQLEEEVQRVDQELATAYEELQTTNEELETTNEELQSTVEELETTNEELQSTNEELETMNEELQSTNEELQTINDELRLRNLEYDEVNAFLGAIVGSLRAGVVVVDQDLAVRAWSDRSAELWGLREDEVLGQGLFGLDIGLPVRELAGAVQACLTGASPMEEVAIDAVNRRGRAIRCRVTASPLRDGTARPLGVLLVVADVEEQAVPS